MSNKICASTNWNDLNIKNQVCVNGIKYTIKHGGEKDGYLLAQLYSEDLINSYSYKTLYASLNGVYVVIKGRRVYIQE